MPFIGLVGPDKAFFGTVALVGWPNANVLTTSRDKVIVGADAFCLTNLVRKASEAVTSSDWSP